MNLRHLPPAHSPLTMAAVLRGLGATLSGEAARQALAERLRLTFGADDVLLTDSGTSALALAIRMVLAQRAGSVVALPAWGCYDLATATDVAQAKAVLYDVDPATLGPDVASLRRALATGVGAVVVAHWFGIPADITAVIQEARAAGAEVIEDAAQTVGATLDGRPLGAHAPLAVLSFSRGKGLTGGGGGALMARGHAGALTGIRTGLPTGDRGVSAVAGALVQRALAHPSVYALPASLPFLALGRTVYRPPHPPRGIASAQAAIALGVWQRSFEEAAVRRVNARALLDATPASFARVSAPAGADPSWLRLPLLVPADVALTADGAAAHALGIYRGYPLALADLPGFGERVGNRDAGFPGARALAARLITLPTHSLLDGRSLEALKEWMAAAVSGRRAARRTAPRIRPPSGGG